MSRIEITRLQFKDQKTPFSSRFDDIYFAPGTGIEESTHVYLEGSSYLTHLKSGKKHLTVAEIGFGVGLNFLLTLKAFREHASLGQTLNYFSAEQYPVMLSDLKKLYAEYPELEKEVTLLFDQYPVLTPGVHLLSFLKGRVQLYLCLGEATEIFSKLEFKADHWYWDGFAPSRNPDAFSESLFKQVARLSAPGARGSSFTAAGWVRRGLEPLGFRIEKRPGFGLKRENLCATFHGETRPSILAPWFSNQNLLILKPGDQVAVIGAGLAGSSIARALANRGIEVHVFDSHGIAARTSGNTVGLYDIQLSKKPNPLSRFAQASLAHFLQEIKRLSIQTKKGILRTEMADESTLLESNYPEDFYKKTEHGFYFPECGMINPIHLCQTRLNHPLIHFKKETISRKPENFAHIVYAGGSDSPPPLQPTKAIRGQTILVQPNLSSKDLPHVLVEQGYASPLAPEITGHDYHLIGASYQAKNIAPDQESIDNEALILHAQEKWKAFKTDTPSDIVSHKVGYRLSTPDKMPLIGPVVDPAQIRSMYERALRGAQSMKVPPLKVNAGEWIFTAFGSRGITMTSLGAEILASLMTGDPIPIENDVWEHLHSARFFVRNSRHSRVE